MIFLPLAYYKSLTIFFVYTAKMNITFVKITFIEKLCPQKIKILEMYVIGLSYIDATKLGIEGSDNYQKICHFCVDAIFLAKVLLQNKILNYAKMSYKTSCISYFIPFIHF